MRVVHLNEVPRVNIEDEVVVTSPARSNELQLEVEPDAEVAASQRHVAVTVSPHHGGRYQGQARVPVVEIDLGGIRSYVKVEFPSFLPFAHLVNQVAVGGGILLFKSQVHGETSF